ncbi:aldehyde oxidase [Sulfolobus acidocaldarius SUSAZ]|nr:aldehyde oxidase [Sulfolobus acidocaldarius SUSAZ]
MFKEGLRFVKGEGSYIDDMIIKEYKNHLYVSILRSPYAHALIKKIDYSDASRAGVKVITFKDLMNFLSPFPLSLDTKVEYYPIARDKAVYYGEPVALVIAKDQYEAEDAKELIQVDYEPIRPVVTIEDSLKSEPIHPQVKSNIVLNKTFTFGDFQYESEKSEVVVENKLKFPRYSCSPLETYEVFARYDGDKYEIYSNFQGPYSIHYLLTKALRADILLKGPRDIGGSFGIKSAIYPYMALIASASRVIGRPLLWRETRSEHVIASSAGAERESVVKVYGNRSGKINAIEIKAIDNLGAYPRPPEPGNLLRNHGNLTGAYDIKSMKVNYMAVLTNTIPTGLNRGYGAPHLYTAIETTIDMFADEIKMDPLDVRMKNVIKDEYYETASGGKYRSFSCYKVLRRMKEVYDEFSADAEMERAKGKRIGVGVSLIIEPSGTNIGYLDLARESSDFLPKSSAQDVVMVYIDLYGKVKVFVNGSNEGQGHETIISEQVSRRLGVKPQDVDVIYRTDTERPWAVSSGTYSSRFAPIVMEALNRALESLEDKLLLAASELLGVQKSSLKIKEGKVTTVTEDKSISLRQLVGIFHWDPIKLRNTEQGLVAVGHFQSPYANDLKEGKINSSISYGCMGQVVEVEIGETEMPSIRRAYVIHDAGKILNEKIAEGQIVGASFQGVEVSLFSSLEYNEDGIPVSQNFSDYLVLTAMESPNIEVQHITSDPNHVAGLGEGGIISMPPAIINALRKVIKISTIPALREITGSK